MSHYVTVAVKYRDQAALVEALEELAGEGNVEVLVEPRALVGYHGRLGEPCHIIVKARGSALGNMYGDLGFRRNSDGTFTQFVDASNAGRIATLGQRYAVIVATKQARLSGYTVARQELPDGKVQLKLSKWGG